MARYDVLGQDLGLRSSVSGGQVGVAVEVEFRRAGRLECLSLSRWD